MPAQATRDSSGDTFVMHASSIFSRPAALAAAAVLSLGIGALALSSAATAQSFGAPAQTCAKPRVPVIPADVSRLAERDIDRMRLERDAYFRDADTYRACIDREIWSIANEPESAANVAAIETRKRNHIEVSEAKGAIYGNFTMACITWEDANRRAYAAGCSPAMTQASVSRTGGG
jgi:hypothetical protein